MKKNTEITIIIEGGEKLFDDDINAYYLMMEKIKATVKDTFPRVRYCNVETWGAGYYRRARILNNSL